MRTRGNDGENRQISVPNRCQDLIINARACLPRAQARDDYSDSNQDDSGPDRDPQLLLLHISTSRMTHTSAQARRLWSSAPQSERVAADVHTHPEPSAWTRAHNLLLSGERQKVSFLR